MSKQYDAFVEDQSNDRRHQREKTVTDEFFLQRPLLDLKHHGTVSECLEHKERIIQEVASGYNYPRAVMQ
jgi:hypothetical protein